MLRSFGSFGSSLRPGQTYTEEFDLFTNRLEAAVEMNKSTKISTERVVAASAFSENFTTLYQQDSVSLRAFVRFLVRLYREYEPGKPLTVPIVDGTPYGLSIEIQVPSEFDISDFDEMVRQEWSNPDAYTWSNTLRDSREIIAEQGLLDGGVSVSKSLLLLAMMKAYAAVFLPTMVRSYAICDGSVGIRFVTSKEANYINISGGVTSYEVTLEAAKSVVDYLDQEGF